MALKRLIAKLEDVEEKFRPAYSPNSSGDGFVLDAEPDPDISKLGEFRENNRKMKEQLEAWVALGMTPEQAKAKLVEQKKKADDAENEKLSMKQLEEKYSKQLSDSEKAGNDKVAALQAKLDAHEIRGPIRQALLKAGAIAGDVDDLIDSLERRNRFRRGEDGKLQILDEQGDPQLNVTADKFAEQVRKERARWFEPLKPGGSGAKLNEAPQRTEAVQEIDVSNQAAINANIDAIAEGKAVVVAGSEG